MLVKYVLCVFYVLLVLIFTNGIVHYIFLCSHFFHKTLFFMTIKVAIYIACRICWVLHSSMWCVCLLCLSIHSLTQLPAANMHTFPYIFSLTDLLLWDLKAREGSADGRTSIHLIKLGGSSVTQRVTQFACPPGKHEDPHVLNPNRHSALSRFQIFDSLKGVKWYLILICICNYELVWAWIQRLRPFTSYFLLFSLFFSHCLFGTAILSLSWWHSFFCSLDPGSVNFGLWIHSDLLPVFI